MGFSLSRETGRTGPSAIVGERAELTNPMPLNTLTQSYSIQELALSSTSAADWRMSELIVNQSKTSYPKNAQPSHHLCEPSMSDGKFPSVFHLPNVYRSTFLPL